MRTTSASDAELLEQSLERPGAGLDAPTRRVAPSCASATRASGSGASVKTPSVTPAAGERLQGRARRRVASEVRGRVILREALEQRAPVAGADAVEDCGGLGPIRRQRPRIDVEHGARRLEPGGPQRSRVADGVEVDGERASARHASRRARTDCQSAIPTATPTASMATSSGDPCRPATNVWCTSSLIA